MRRIWTVVCLGVLAMGCVTDAGRCHYPIEDFLPSSTADFGLGGGGIGGSGSCPAVVVVDGVSYRDTRFDGWHFDLAPDDLTPYGGASEATFWVAPIADASVWRIRGLDADQYLAMPSADDGAHFILVAMGTELTQDVDAVLCRFANGRDDIIRSHCADGP